MNEEEDFGSESIVIDNGSDTMKAGFAWKDYPGAVFSSFIAYPSYTNPSYTNQMVGVSNSKTYFIGDEAQQKRKVCKIKYPIAYGKI